MFKLNTRTDEEIIMTVYKLSRLMRKQTAYQPSTQELSMLQLQTLMVIQAGTTTMSDIAEELCIKMPTATILMERLVESGDVERFKDKADRRLIKVKLTAKGKKILTNTLKAKMKRIQYILDCLNPKDKITLYKIIRNLYQKLEKNKT